MGKKQVLINKHASLSKGALPDKKTLKVLLQDVISLIDLDSNHLLQKMLPYRKTVLRFLKEQRSLPI